jgi:hypothetical protein
MTPGPKKLASDDRRVKVLRKVMANKAANWFHVPVDPVALGIPNYFDIIKTPMDLGTVRKKLDLGEYEGAEDFAVDVRLVFSNATIFNPPNSLVYNDALILSAIFEKDFGSKLEGSTPAPVIATPKAVAKRAAPAFNELDAAQKILNKLLESKHSAIFKYPVDGEMYPDYYRIITSPVDLQAIGKKISTKLYPNFQGFHNDIQLLIANCFTFNKKGTFGFSAGTEFQNVYQRNIKNLLRLLDPATVILRF